MDYDWGFLGLCMIFVFNSFFGFLPVCTVYTIYWTCPQQNSIRTLIAHRMSEMSDRTSECQHICETLLECYGGDHSKKAILMWYGTNWYSNHRPPIAEIFTPPRPPRQFAWVAPWARRCRRGPWAPPCRRRFPRRRRRRQAAGDPAPRLRVSLRQRRSRRSPWNERGEKDGKGWTDFSNCSIMVNHDQSWSIWRYMINGKDVDYCFFDLMMLLEHTGWPKKMSDRLIKDGSAPEIKMLRPKTRCLKHFDCIWMPPFCHLPFTQAASEKSCRLKQSCYIRTWIPVSSISCHRHPDLRCVNTNSWPAILLLFMSLNFYSAHHHECANPSIGSCAKHHFSGSQFYEHLTPLEPVTMSHPHLRDEMWHDRKWWNMAYLPVQYCPLLHDLMMCLSGFFVG